MAAPLRVREVATHPFPYFLAEQCFAGNFQKRLLDWLEQDAPWQLVETDFYEQYEFRLFDADLPSELRHLFAPSEISQLSAQIEEIFHCNLSDRVELVAHKLVPGQRIALHNDYLIGGESHRLTVQFNRDLVDEDGGFFILFNTFDPNDIHRILRPVSGSAIGFEISANSNHAVSRVHGGERYTLVYSFYENRTKIVY